MSLGEGRRPALRQTLLGLAAGLHLACGGALAAASDAPSHAVTWLAEAERQALHRHPTWKALLHYRANWLGSVESRVDSASFFLANDGQHDPRAELRATLRAFSIQAPQAGGEHALCRFPARRRWLTKALGIEQSSLPDVQCTNLESWLGRLNPSGLSLIFAEAFMDDPSSMFGHTFLRIDAEETTAGKDLLGYAINFAARTGSETLPVYLFKGMAGFFPGQFSVLRYYEGLKRYSDWENRDIWEYELEIDPEGLDFMLLHLWELLEAELPYYFFTENCSYELLGLIDLAAPGHDLREQFPAWVIPVDTMRTIVERTNLVRAIRFRPSPETELRRQLGRLSGTDRDLVAQLASGAIEPTGAELVGLPAQRSARILEAAYDRLRYDYLRGAIDEDESRKHSYAILRARSQLPASNDPPPLPPSDPPHTGHRSALASIAGGWRDDETFVEVSLRPALHALIDDPRGYRDGMAMRILDTKVRMFPTASRVHLHQLTLIGITSLPPLNRVFRPWAWSFETGLKTTRVPRTSGLADASVWQTRLTGGIAHDLSSHLTAYGLAGVRLDVGTQLRDDVGFGPIAEAGAFLALGDNTRAQVFGEITPFVGGVSTTDMGGGARLRYSTTRNTAIVVEGTANRIYDSTWFEGILRAQIHF